MECYMKTLKGFVQMHVRLEGSMAEGYAMQETLGYCAKYLTRFEPTSKRVWNDKKNPIMNDEIVQGGGLYNYQHPLRISLLKTCSKRTPFFIKWTFTTRTHSTSLDEHAILPL